MQAQPYGLMSGPPFSSRDLKQRQDQLTQENSEALGRVMKQRQHIKQLMSLLEGSVAELEKSANMLDPDEIDALRAESRSANETTMADAAGRS